MEKNTVYKILVVDDDKLLLELLENFFKKRQYDVSCASNVKEAAKIISTARLDCIILDIDLPDGNGFDLCMEIRESSMLPIIFLSSYTEEEARVKGLRIGGDDYICKPFYISELEARVNLRIRSRNAEIPNLIMVFDGLRIDTGTRQVFYLDKTVDFSRIEFDILAYLARTPGRVFSYEQLYNAVWKEPLNMGRHALQARIAEVRQKLNQLCPDREFIQTIRHKGYRFTS